MKSFKNYFLYAFDFWGVESRKNFWPPFLCTMVLMSMSFVFLFMSFLFQLVGLIVSLVLIIPTSSAVVRRLHDTDRSARNMLWLLVPLVGAVILIIFLTEKTKYVVPESNHGF